MPVYTQSPAFYHLSTAEGLSDNNVNMAVRDRTGMLWIATTEGLNSFDGNRITTYQKYQYPGLADNNIERILIDDANHIWIRTNTKYITHLDENRTFHLIPVGDTADKNPVSSIFKTSNGIIYATKGSQHYQFSKMNNGSFEKIKMPFDSLLTGTIGFNYYTDRDWVIYYRNKRLIVVDYKTKKVLLNLALPGINGAHYINDDELIAFAANGDVFYRISILQQKIIKEYRNIRDQHNMAVDGPLRNMTRIDENRFAFTTYFSGLYLLDLQKETVQHWIHDPVDRQSIGGNNTFNIRYDTSGYLFVTTQTSGLHFINIKQRNAFNKSYFIDEHKQIFDGYIQSVTTDDASNVWMGAQDRLIRWNRATDKSQYVSCYLLDGTNITGKETIREVSIDQAGNLWVGTSRHGIIILNKQLKTIAQITDSLPGKRTSFPSGWINAMAEDRKGNQWVGTLRGTCIIEKNTLKIISLTDHPLLKELSRIACVSLWNDGEGKMWIGTIRGAWCYDEEKNTLKQYSTKQGLANNIINAVNYDGIGNTYFATSGGLSVLSKEGKIVNYNRTNGLRNDRCEGILKDEKGFIWIGNLNCIIRYDPTNKKFAVYEEGQGFSHAGFRMRSAHLSRSGEMFWGTDKGLTWFYPGEMTSLSTPLYPVTHTLLTRDSVFRFTGTDDLSFPYYTSSFVFQFSSGDLTGGRKSQFLYRLKEFEKEWKTPLSPGQVTYSKLPPGIYYFEIKASKDGITWYDAANSIRVVIDKPWWQKNVFRLFCLLLLITGGYLIIRYHNKRKKAKAIEEMIGYFAHSGYENVPVEEILWDICRNCIARMGFEDCVIYLNNEERKVLVQKAAYGPKILKGNEILNPIEIALGKGIVGDVAITKKPSIVNDTSKDSRYFVDDENRLSEITVPIIHEGKVIGVIDSENRKRNFFDQQHLKALQAIASLCSAKISNALAMDAMKKSKMELMELNVKMAESRFSNLRLQMNPHFLFNSLSSIQHLIVSQQTTKAYKYLTVFSNFLRTLLNFAEKNFIPLDEELKILKMYIELESLRFDQSFYYEITVDDNLTNDEVLVPSLMVQPFAENAIWHGLLHKEGEKKLSIRFTQSSEDYLSCIIEDNGIGRKASEIIQKNKVSSMMHESKGIGIIEERLLLLQQKTGKPAKVEIEDLYTSENEAAGTRICITIPYYNPEEL